MELSQLGAGAGIRGAYKTSQGLKSEQKVPFAAETPKTSFSDLVRDAGADAVQTIREADVALQDGLQGKISTQQMIEATLEAEATLSQVVGLRDKLVQAYQEVLRMPV
jgi:flagellar hook-basal body complex protein FliE